MEREMQFGGLEEVGPQRQARPDGNCHCAVAACGDPSPDDLPIFVDLDVMYDMEEHALSNEDVELGGVLLGGQYADQEGRPFVVISYSLRARHYESTKGSFKFTHDTWTDITRRREALGEDLQMVGWYHTHPEWGVFLSGMDMFICDNFFNKALDVALVIDPCRQDRGFFQWTAEGQERVRRTAGFYLMASRFRHDEAADYAAQLEGSVTMAEDTRYTRGVRPAGHSGAPVVHITEQRAQWHGTAVFALLTMQFALLALIAWRMMVPQAQVPAAAPPAAAALQAERKLLDRVYGHVDVAPDGVVSALIEAWDAAEKLNVVSSGLHAEVNRLRQGEAESRRQQQDLEDELLKVRAELDAVSERSRNQSAHIEQLQASVAGTDQLGDLSGSGSNSAAWNWQSIAMGAAVTGLAFCSLILGLTVHWRRRLRQARAP